jgi:hypothetical protein
VLSCRTDQQQLHRISCPQHLVRWSEAAAALLYLSQHSLA